LFLSNKISIIVLALLPQYNYRGGSDINKKNMSLRGKYYGGLKKPLKSIILYIGEKI
jgi:hypothetical protein